MSTWVRALPGPMNELAEALSITEEGARSLLEEACRRRGVLCPRCGARDPYVLASRRLRCRDCRLSFGLFTGRWLARCRIPARSWIVLLRCFVRLPNVRELAQLSGLAPLTAFRAVAALRRSLIAADPHWGTLHSPGMDDRKEEPAFAVLSSGDSVRVTPVPLDPAALRPEHVLHRDGIVYLRAGEDRRALLLHGGQAGGLPRGPRARKRPEDPFLGFLLKRASLHRGMQRRSFPLYVKEWECRYNLDGERFFAHLLDSLARFTPKAAGGSRTCYAPW